MGALIVLTILGFTIWSSMGELWHQWLLNFLIVGISTVVVCTNLIQGLARSISYIYLYKFKGIPKAALMISPVLLFLFIAYFILGFVFDNLVQYISFFGITIFFSIIVAIIDGEFKTAITRTKTIENED